MTDTAIPIPPNLPVYEKPKEFVKVEMPLIAQEASRNAGEVLGRILNHGKNSSPPAKHAGRSGKVVKNARKKIKTRFRKKSHGLT